MARLGELERAVMEVLWARPAPGADPDASGAGEAHGPDPGAGTAGAPDRGAGLTGREVLAALAGRDLAYTTVMTVLDRLAGKQMVRRVRDGQAWRYRPAAPRDAYIAQLMLAALDLAEPAAGGDHRGAALVRFARSVSGDDAERLRAALAEQAGPREDPEG